MNRISVLWFEDRHEDDKWKGFKLLAKKAGIELHAHDNMESGIKAVQDYPDLYDVILLDANFYESQENKLADQKNSIHAREKIKETVNKRYDFFVYTGEEKTKNSDTYTSIFEKDNDERRIFYKGDEEERVKLFEALKKSAQNQPILEIKSHFSDAYLAYSLNNLGLKKSIDEFIKVSNYLTKKVDKISPNDIRLIVEDVLISFTRIGLLSETIFRTKSSLTKARYFLRGTHTSYRFDNSYKDILDDSIIAAIELLITACNEDEHIQSKNGFFSLMTLSHVLFETLGSLTESFKEIKNTESNKKTWSPKYRIGKLEKGERSLILSHTGGAFSLPEYLNGFRFNPGKDYMVTTDYKDKMPRPILLYNKKNY